MRINTSFFENKYIGYLVDILIIGLTVIPGIAAEYYTIPEKIYSGLLCITWGWVFILVNYHPKFCLIFRIINLLETISFRDFINPEGRKSGFMMAGIILNVLGIFEFFW